MSLIKKPNICIEDLMDGPGVDHTDTGIRIFKTSSGDSFLGVVFAEFDDSFLIFFPSRLLASGDKRLIEPYMLIPYFRAFKTGIPIVLPAYGEFEYFYLEYLVANTLDMLPEFESIAPGQLNSMKDRLRILKGGNSGGPSQPVLVTATEALAGTQTPAVSEEEEGEILYVSPSFSKYKH